jgi:hypothetical protein
MAEQRYAAGDGYEEKVLEQAGAAFYALVFYV